MKVKHVFAKGMKFLTDPQYRFLILANRGRYDQMPDEAYLKRKFQAMMGKTLDLQNPKTFNEKLQWLKLYNRRPEYTVMVDKYKVREYIAQKLGEEYLIPLLGVWEDPEQIDFDALPDRFVLKCNHNSGLGMCICKDKTKLDLKQVKAELRAGLAQDYYLTGREWPYKDVPRKIICEQFMGDPSGEALSDYKVLCFDGEPQFIEIHRGRFGKHTQDFYDAHTWKNAKIEQPCVDMSGIEMEKPVFAEEMMELTRKLAQGMPHVRIDWYYTNNRLYFGEITFFDGSGFDAFTDEKVDSMLGSYITLPEHRTN